MNPPGLTGHRKAQAASDTQPPAISAGLATITSPSRPAIRRLKSQTTIRPPTIFLACGIAALSLMTAVPSAEAAAQPAGPAREQNDVTFRAPWNGELLGTGGRRPNAEQWKWGEANLIKTKKVKLNRLGLERVNEHRRGLGLRPLFETEVEVVELGREASATSPGSTTDATTTALVGSTPSGVDNSQLKYFPPIRSQGSLNSCGQFSAVYYTLTHMTAMARDWDAKNGGDAFRFSPKWTYNMVNGGANVGSWHTDAYGIAQKHGLATWAEFPYDSDYRAWCLKPDAWWNSLSVRADRSGKVQAINTDTGLNQVKQLLLNGYVLNFATYINSWVWTTIGNDPATAADDVLAGKKVVKAVNGTSGGHAMTIVGYNDDIWVDINGNGVVDVGEKGALRIANSWGTGWNEAGYAWVAYQALRTRNAAYTAEGLAWYDEATWVTARPSYTPKLVAQFTLNHIKRSQLVMTLGISDVTKTAPTTTWSTYRVLASAGGAYAFDGSTTPKDGTYYLDFTDVLPTTAGAKRYYLGVRDSTTGDASTLASFSLVDNVNNKQILFPYVPHSTDGTQDYAYLDYDFSSGALPPVADATVSATSGNIPFTVSFDGSGSFDPDGQIVSYQWNFGNGTTASGVTAQCTYTKAGTFTATLTVTDNDGGQAAATAVITVIDPTVVNAPTNLSGKASGRTVTLTWLDKSLNETGFYVERGLKTKTGIIYERIATLPANTTTYTETVAANTYYYRVQAVNDVTGTTSGYSNAISLRVR
jgi:C1A family cysteine protease